MRQCSCDEALSPGADTPEHAVSESVPSAGDGERKGRPDAQYALDREVAAHPSREIAADGEAEPRAFVRPSQGRADLHERLEDRRELFGGDPAPRVTDNELDGHLVRRQRDVSTGCGEPD